MFSDERFADDVAVEERCGGVGIGVVEVEGFVLTDLEDLWRRGEGARGG